MAGDGFSGDAIKANLNTQIMGRELYFFESLPTTMGVADAKAKEGAPEGTVIVADYQTAGRGRFGRAWLTPKGATIAVSIILRPMPDQLPRINMIASLGVVRSIEHCCDLTPRIKWPNDVLIEGQKVSGILLTSSFQGDRLEHVNMGIGINVNLDREIVSEISPPATSLSVETGHAVSRLQLFCTLMEELESLYLAMRQGDDLLVQWVPYVATVGQQVQVKWRREDLKGYVERGYAESVDEEGRLVLLLSDGSRKTLVAGEVTLHGDRL